VPVLQAGNLTILPRVHCNAACRIACSARCLYLVRVVQHDQQPAGSTISHLPAFTYAHLLLLWAVCRAVLLVLLQV
jgi:hypothetical protein